MIRARARATEPLTSGIHLTERSPSYVKKLGKGVDDLAPVIRCIQEEKPSNMMELLRLSRVMNFIKIKGEMAMLSEGPKVTLIGLYKAKLMWKKEENNVVFILPKKGG